MKSPGHAQTIASPRMRYPRRFRPLIILLHICSLRLHPSIRAWIFSLQFSIILNDDTSLLAAVIAFRTRSSGRLKQWMSIVWVSTLSWLIFVYTAKTWCHALSACICKACQPTRHGTASVYAGKTIGVMPCRHTLFYQGKCGIRHDIHLASRDPMLRWDRCVNTGCARIWGYRYWHD